MALLAAKTVAAQDLELKKKTVPLPYTNGAKEIFYVLKTQKDLRHGAYLQEDAKGMVRIVGQYEQGQPTGQWTFYDDLAGGGRIIHKYVYDVASQRVTFYGVGHHPAYAPGQRPVFDTLSYETLPGHPAFYPMGWLVYQSKCHEHLRQVVEEKNIRNMPAGLAYVSYMINEKGEAGDVQVEMGIPGLNNEILKQLVERAVTTVPGRWIPQRNEQGQIEPSKQVWPIRFSP